MSAMRQDALLVDDDAVFRDRLAAALTSRGLDVRRAGSPDEAMAAARERAPEVALVDLRMPGGSGLDLVERLHALDPEMRIVVLTGFGSIATALDAMRRGAVDYLTKPAGVDEILQAFERPGAGCAEELDEVPSLARVEWEHIQRVLTECGGNVSHTARLLGLHRRSLQRKLSKYPARR